MRDIKKLTHNQRKEYLKKVIFVMGKVNMDYECARSLDEEELDDILDVLRDSAQARRNAAIDSFRINPGVKAPVKTKVKVNK